MNIEINGKQYDTEELSPEVQVMIARVTTLRQEAAELSQLINEKQVLVETYSNTIVAAIEESEKEEEADVTEG